MTGSRADAPDRAYFHDGGLDVWYPTAAIVVEIVSPGDESRQKSAFYHRVGVEEVLIVGSGRPDRGVVHAWPGGIPTG